MAGGIDWFRWHHGSVTDPKFGLVAKRANARRGDVVAIWAYLLEQASQSADRGAIGAIDCDSIDLMLDCDEGTTAAVLVEFEARGMTVVTLRDTQHVTRIAKWDERQPKREDETAADRKRRQREREHELAIAAGVTRNASRDVTQKTVDVTQEKADVTHGHDRGEESREEKKPTADAVGGGSALKRSTPPSAPPAFDGANESQIPARAVVTLSPQFDLPEQWGEDAERLGWTPDRILTEAERFRQYFVAGKGAGTRRGLKGWRQGWSNWLSKAETPRYAR